MRLLYILGPGRRERLECGENFPDELFYGFTQLARRPGWRVELEERRFPSRLGHWVQRRVHSLTHLSPDFANARELGAEKLGRFDCVVAVHEPILLMLALARRRGRDGAALVLIFIGGEKRLERSRAPWLTRRLLRWLFSRLAAVVVLGEGEKDHLLAEALAAPERIHVVQFGVDLSFWTPASEPRGNGKPRVLAVGNDSGRDYETLLQAIGSRPLRLHTSLRLSRVPSNVLRTRGTYRDRALSDGELRELYRDALFVVTPLKESAQPQGQSVTLQAMACGKAVILSKTLGLWSRDRMRHRENCYLVPPGDVDALRTALEELSRDVALRERLGREARKSVLNHFSSDQMADRIGDVIESAAPSAFEPSAG